MIEVIVKCMRLKRFNVVYGLRVCALSVNVLVLNIGVIANEHW